MNWLQKISNLVIPDKLYHATYGANVDSILQQGLIPRYTCVWEDCDYGVYLCSDKLVAMSFAETADSFSGENEDIVIFEVDSNLLNKNLLETDPHYKWEHNPQGFSSWIYKDVIPPAALRRVRP